jgi:sterol desaturase/sphingolipid hydroxylase (fatty acid hydroxylase superfamily)
MYKAATTTVLGAAQIAGWFAFGLFFWTLTEYLLHRFVFHYEPTTEWGKSLIFLFHGVHHAYPNDSLRLVMPPVVSIPLATLFYFLFLAVFGETLTAPFFSGFIVGYLIYDEMHYASHHFPLKSKLGLSIKHHHMKHHYQNESLGYGVSSQLWDYVFGTTFPEKKESH